MTKFFLGSVLDNWLVVFLILFFSGFVTFVFAAMAPAEVTLISPPDSYNFGSEDINFTCNATKSYFSAYLTNITLYGNWNGGWHANETVNVSGISNGTSFLKSLPSGSYGWTCFACDDYVCESYEATPDRTFSVDKISPSIVIESPDVQNYSSLFVNLSLNEDGYCEYSIGGSNISMNSGGNSFNHTNSTLPDGTYILRAYCNDSFGNRNDSEVVTFQIDRTAPTFVRFRNLSAIVNESFSWNIIALDNLNVSYFLNDTSMFNISQTGELFNITPLINTTNYFLNLSVTDSLGNLNWSEFMIYVSHIAFNEFEGDTTDFSSVSIDNITNLILEVLSFGKINFTGIINLSSGANLDSIVNISANRIEVNSTALVELNKPARVFFYGLNYTNPRILRDDVFCSNCVEVDYNVSTGIFIFDVSGFSVYTSEETPTCGDGTCNGEETSYSCSADCGSFSSGGDSSSVSDEEGVENISEIVEVTPLEDIGYDTPQKEIVEEEVVSKVEEGMVDFGSNSFGHWALRVVLGLILVGVVLAVVRGGFLKERKPIAKKKSVSKKKLSKKIMLLFAIIIF